MSAPLPLHELAIPPRLMMGPGPIDADPRVLRAMSAPLLGQFDPAFRAAMAETMALYRAVFRTVNPQTMVIDGTARAGIEAALVSLLEPGDKVLVPIFGRFGHLLVEIAERAGAQVRAIEAPWGEVFAPEQIEAAARAFGPKVIAVVQGDTSTTMAQPLADIGSIAARTGALVYCDTTATLGGMAFETDTWGIDIATAGLQKCLAGPPGVAPITISPRAAEAIFRRRHVERGIADPAGSNGFGPGRRIGSNYFDLAMVMDYWSERALNHHTEATSMLYAARESARILLLEGLEAAFARHAAASGALRRGLEAMGLSLYGDPAHRMPNVTGVWIPDGVDGEGLRRRMLEDFGIEIGTSFGPLKGRIWRIGTMGYNARKDTVLRTLGALDACLAAGGFRLPRGAGVDAALAAF